MMKKKENLDNIQEIFEKNVLEIIPFIENGTFIKTNKVINEEFQLFCDQLIEHKWNVIKFKGFYDLSRKTVDIILPEINIKFRTHRDNILYLVGSGILKKQLYEI